MKKLIILLFTICFLIPEAYALKRYSYDSEGNRVYQKVVSKYDNSQTGYRARRSSSGRFIVYDGNGNKLKTYYNNKNKTIVYDGNGKKIRTYRTAPNGNTYVYNEHGEKINVYKYKSGRNSYISEQPYRRGSYGSGQGRTFVTTGNRAYSHQFKGSGRSFSSKTPSGVGTQIVSTNRALYRYKSF